MLTHPDPQVQILFDDLAEQRDAAMVKCANLSLALKKANEKIGAQELEIEHLKTPGSVLLEIPQE